MTSNLYGERIYELDELCSIINQRAMRNGVFELKHSYDSDKQGFWTIPQTSFSLHKLPGFYSIFKDDVLEYIGRSDSDIGNRLSRFVKEVNLKSRHDENHPAGKKWRVWHGVGNFSGCKVMFSEWYDHDMKEYGYNRGVIEKRLIQLHKPRMNVR